MVEVESGYRGVSIKRALIDAVEEYIQNDKTYGSVSAFISEALRLRLETLKAQRKGCA
jgi:Arc/MetJ-type ribon-helix-helix transcriptional regulator